ncbi:MAG: 30S ribosomal protein S4 [Deltaproteobacteria bacterium]|nr:30S ribosomal protein S4 [Deltaproteobacteria bacterium]
MSRYTGPRLRIVRRLGGADIPGLILPRELRRPYPPGQHGPTQRIKLSDYAIRLREKQKLRAHYGVSEHQLVRYMKRAKRGKGNTGEYLLRILESRLDNVVFRLGFARTMRGARQLVGHGHINVNGARIDIPSYQCKMGDEISVRVTGKHREAIAAEVAAPVSLPMPSFLERDDANLKGTVKSQPAENDCPLGINESLVVELYALAL